MLKKILVIGLLSSVLSACATAPKSVNRHDVANAAEIKIGLDEIQVKGEKVQVQTIEQIPALRVLKIESTVYLTDSTEDKMVHSRVFIDFKYIENYKVYPLVRLGDTLYEAKKRKMAVRNCDDQCTIVASIYIDVPTEALSAASDNGIQLALQQSPNSDALHFQLPAYYIDGLFDRLVMEKQKLVPVPEAEPSTAIAMSQYWFNKVSPEEQIAFTTWAISHVSSTEAYVTEHKELEKLSYWYAQANSQEQLQLRRWAVDQIQ